MLDCEPAVVDCADHADVVVWAVQRLFNVGSFAVISYVSNILNDYSGLKMDRFDVGPYT